MLLHGVRVLPVVRLPPTIIAVMAGLGLAPQEKSAETIASEVRDRSIDRGLARYAAALRLVAQNRDKLGAIIGLAAQGLVRDDDRGSRQCGRRDAIEHFLRNGDAVERVLCVVRVFDRD